MSDTTAFLAGCAITGVAAILMLGGGLAVSPYRAPEPVQPSLPTTGAGLPTAPIPVPPNSTMLQGSEHELQLEKELEQQQAETEDLKNQLEKYRTETEDLKNQLEKQQTDTQQLALRLQEQQRLIDAMAAQQSRLADPFDQPSRIQTVFFGAVGVVLLIVAVGGGIILIGVVIVLVMQSQRRFPRSMHVVQPIPSTYTFSEQEFLPPPTRTRRTKQVEYYDD